MGKEKILIKCPWCGGQKIIDDLALSDTIKLSKIIKLSDINKRIDKLIDKPEDAILFDFTCLECGRGFTSQDIKKDDSSGKDSPED